MFLFNRAGGQPISVRILQPSCHGMLRFRKPTRDGALENDVVLHELMHGVTNRMTGGGTAKCLQVVQSGNCGSLHIPPSLMLPSRWTW